MKKDTVYGWLLRQRELASRKEKQEAIRNAKRTALKQCEEWLFALTWAQMRAPVRAKRTAIESEALPLLARKNEQVASLSEQETSRLNELAASDEIYMQFLSKITPTALQAECDLEQRQREQARRAASRRPGDVS